MAGGQGAVGEVRVMPDRLHAFTMAICRADGSSDQEARLVADHLVLANLFGHDSHGVGMMPHYIQNTGNGACVRNHHAKISRDNGAVIVVDGGAGYGQVVAKEAMDIGIERAKKHGVCVVGLKNAHHIGRIGHWGEQCARAGMVSTHWVNVHGHKSLVAPFGGAEPRFTTNPYCTAVPRKGKEPIVLDFATSQVAAGKVRVAHNKKTPMDPGLLIDSEGNATADPGVLYNAPYGAILPFGLHKGGGLAVICDILAGALTGMLHGKSASYLTDLMPNQFSMAPRYVREFAGRTGFTAPERDLFALLEAEKHTGMTLTESFAMLPAAAVSGFYFSHPQSNYFAVGKIGRDQVEDYAQRSGVSVSEAERWLAPNLAYDPDSGAGR